MSSNYSAIVTTIKNVRPHPNADRLQLTDLYGNQVIIGKDVKVGDRGLFFPLESQIGLEFATVNDLIRRKDENGKPAGGMFDQNRRVRAQTLRGEKSMGFFIEIEALWRLFPHLSGLVYTEGTEIEQIDTINISTKYIPKFNQTPGLGKKNKEGRKPRESKIIPDQFRFHFDTAQLGRNIHRINPSDIVVITWKMHGTSAIVGNVLTKRKLGFFDKIASVLGVSIDKSQYDYIYASRKVIKNEFMESKNHYYGEDLWTEIGKHWFGGKLRTGEQVYYEIVGYTPQGKAIQGGFDYGCDPSGQLGPQHKIYVYRITMTASDGSVTELQWNQVKERCKEIGVETVPEIFYGDADITYVPKETLASASGFTQTIGETLEEWQQKYLEFLQKKFVYDQDSQFCKNKVPEEGICLRKEGSSIEVYKLKSFRFLEHETKTLDIGEVDTETQESLA